jgi:ribosomal protein L37AE/L43A
MSKERIYEMKGKFKIKISGGKVFGQMSRTKSWVELNDITPNKQSNNNICPECGGTDVRKETFGKRMYCSDCRGFFEV